MELDQFVQLCKDFGEAPSGHGTMESRRLIRAIIVGVEQPSNLPPDNDDIAQQGYEIGREIGRNL